MKNKIVQIKESIISNPFETILAFVVIDIVWIVATWFMIKNR